MTKTNIFIAAAAASVVAGSAIAQQAPFEESRRVDRAIEAVEKQVEDSYDRDMSAFGNAGRTLGWSSSLSATMTATSGNTDTFDLGLGMRTSYYDGTNGHRISLARAFSQLDGATKKDEALFGYDYTRDFGSRMFAFGKLTVAYDMASSYKYDGFLGAGLGYRVIDTDKVQWSVQGGPGYRYAESADGTAEIKETAVALSSYYSNQLTDTVFLTNDTDVLWSEAATKVTNELGLNVAMSDALALRTSLTSKWDENPLSGYEPASNTLGMSVVYSY